MDSNQFKIVSRRRLDEYNCAKENRSIKDSVADAQQYADEDDESYYVLQLVRVVNPTRKRDENEAD